MYYRCLECGHVFENGEQETWSEFRGECHGSTAYEKMSGCPLCKGDYAEIKPCKKCGTLVFKDDWYRQDEMCEKCYGESEEEK